MFGRIAAAVPEIVAVKLMDGDDAWYEQMRAQPGRLALFVPGHQLASGFKRGAAGSYSNVACINPMGACNWYAQMQTQLLAALELESRIQHFMTTHIASHLRGPQARSNQAADKLLATIDGWAEVGTRVRFPYQSFDSDYADTLRPVAESLIPEIICAR